MKTNDFIRKILLPHESLTFYFWSSLLSGIGSSLAGAAVSTAAGYYLGGGKEADKAMKQSTRASGKQSDIASQQWEVYKQNYLPLEQELIEKARQGIEPDIAGVTGRASADVTQAYDNTRESTNRTLGRYGINPNSGRFEGSNRALDIAQAGDKAGAINTARTNEVNRADNVGYSRMASLAQTGRGIPGQVQSNLSSVANTTSNQAKTYGSAASSTSQFISGLPWNDLFSGGGTTKTVASSGGAIPSGGFSQGIEPNSIGGLS